MFTILVPIFTLISIYSKWYRTSAVKKHRFIGYFIQGIPALFWVVYFIGSSQYWICLISCSNIVFIIRGVLNNKKGDDGKGS